MTTPNFRRPGNVVPTRRQLPQAEGDAANSAILKANVAANAGLGMLPTNGFLLYMLARETAGHAVDITVGTTAGGSDVLSAQTVPANGTLTVPTTAFSLGWFSATQPQALFIASASWGGASINASLVYQVGP